MKAATESLPSAINDKERVLVICIDVQNDFMEGGSLGVPGSLKDVERATGWIYDNLTKITRIAVSIDTHNPFQIFFPSWWVDKAGKPAPPFTLITSADIDSGKWTALFEPAKSIDYVKGLEKLGRQVLVIWPYHCIQGTAGHALEGQFTNMIYFHQAARLSKIQYLVKGYKPYTEMYGVFRPEYDPTNVVDTQMLNQIGQYDKIVLLGEAKSHCCLESARQLMEYFGNNMAITSKFYFLTDCMSSVGGFETQGDSGFQELKDKYKVNLVTSDQFKL
jgi:nicotinamidase-related amidase